jgi:PAS domain S-box-containing protein
MRRIFRYLNPIAHLGEKNYSIIFPFLTTLLACVATEFYVYTIAKDPAAVGMIAIAGFLTLIIYFAFREGIRGGFVATVITIAYYLYLIYSRDYTGDRLVSGLETTAVLGVVYVLLSWIIGWLRQTIDTLIEREADERRRLQAIVQQLPVGIIITDQKGKILQGNKQVELLLGKKIRESIIAGKTTGNEIRYNNKPVQPSQWPIAQIFATGKPVIGKEFSIKRADGRDMFVQISASLVHNINDKVIAGVSIITDITEQKEMEARKDDFVNMASHELKTPLTSMKLYIDSLQVKVKKLGDERVDRTVAGLKNQTERLQELVNDLLDVSRLNTGKLALHKDKFRLNTLIEETVEGLQQTMQKQHILVSAKAPVAVNADRFRVYQVLTNLLTNAMKYSPAESQIQVSLRRQNGHAVVSVHDQGIGIAKLQQKKIFERLYQVTDPEVKTFPGLGMGLYISKEIIKRHRGKIWVESEKGKGATFFFSLPTK